MGRPKKEVEDLKNINISFRVNKEFIEILNELKSDRKYRGNKTRLFEELIYQAHDAKITKEKKNNE